MIFTDAEIGNSGSGSKPGPITFGDADIQTKATAAAAPKAKANAIVFGDTDIQTATDSVPAVAPKPPKPSEPSPQSSLWGDITGSLQKVSDTLGQAAGDFTGLSGAVQGAKETAKYIGAEGRSIEPSATGIRGAYRDVVAPAGEASAEFLGGMVHPANFALMGALSALPAAAAVAPKATQMLSSAIRGYFIGSMGVNGLKSAYEAYKAEAKGNVPEAVKKGIEGLIDLTFAGGMATGSGKGYTPLSSEPAERSKQIFRSLVYKTSGESLPADYTPEQASKAFRQAQNNLRDPQSADADHPLSKDLSQAYSELNKHYRTGGEAKGKEPRATQAAGAETVTPAVQLPAPATQAPVAQAPEPAPTPTPPPRPPTPPELANERAAKGTQVSLTLANGTTVVGGIIHPDLVNRAAQAGIASEDELLAATPGFTNQQGETVGHDGKPVVTGGTGKIVRIDDNGKVKQDAQPKAKPAREYKPDAVVGSAAASATDTALFRRAKQELGPKATISEVARRAQELKEKPKAKAAATEEPKAVAKVAPKPESATATDPVLASAYEMSGTTDPAESLRILRNIRASMVRESAEPSDIAEVDGQMKAVTAEVMRKREVKPAPTPTPPPTPAPTLTPQQKRSGIRSQDIRDAGAAANPNDIYEVGRAAKGKRLREWFKKKEAEKVTKSAAGAEAKKDISPQPEPAKISPAMTTTTPSTTKAKAETNRPPLKTQRMVGKGPDMPRYDEYLKYVESGEPEGAIGYEEWIAKHPSLSDRAAEMTRHHNDDAFMSRFRKAIGINRKVIGNSQLYALDPADGKVFHYDAPMHSWTPSDMSAEDFEKLEGKPENKPLRKATVSKSAAEPKGDFDEARADADLKSWIGFDRRARANALDKADFGDENTERLVERAVTQFAIPNRDAFTDMITVAKAIREMDPDYTPGKPYMNAKAVAEAIQYAQDYPNMSISPIKGLEKLAAQTPSTKPGDIGNGVHTIERAKQVLAAVKGADKPADARVQTVAGLLDLDEFERKGYTPDQVTREDWVNLQRAVRRKLGQREESGTRYAPYADYEEYHKQAVKDALAKGEEVDPEVLKGYPDLRSSDSSSASREADVIDGPAHIGDKVNVRWMEWMGDGTIKDIKDNGDIVVTAHEDAMRSGSKFDRTGKEITIPAGVAKRLASRLETAPELVLSKSHQQLPIREAHIRAFLNLATQHGKPAFVIGDELINMSGKMRFRTENGRTTKDKVSDLSREGFERNLMDYGFHADGTPDEHTSYNRFAKEYAERLAKEVSDRRDEAQRKEAEERTSREGKYRKEQEFSQHLQDRLSSTKFHQSKISVGLREGGKAEIKGPSLNGLIVHRSIGDPKYTKTFDVTHMASGMRVVSDLPTQETAKIAAMRLTEIGDWTRSADELQADEQLKSKASVLGRAISRLGVRVTQEEVDKMATAPPEPPKPKKRSKFIKPKTVD